MTKIALASYLKPKWEMLEGMGMIDVLVLPSVFGIFLSVIFYLYLRSDRGSSTRRYLIPAFLASTVSGIVFAIIYNYYYQGGDTFWYYHLSTPFREALRENPLVGLRLFFQPVGTFDAETFDYTSKIWTIYFQRKEVETVFMAKLIGLIESLTFPSYWFTTLVFSIFSFSGKWKLFRTFESRYPGLHRPLAIAILFVPSCLFWGSGILKDTICLGCLGWIIYFLHLILQKPSKSVIYLLPVLIFVRIILLLKAYVVLALLPALALWIYSSYRPNPAGLLLKYTSLPILLASVVLGTGLVISNIAATTSKYDPENLTNRAEGFRIYHKYLAEREGQSYYSLGEINYTVPGIIQKTPAAFNVTYFRPYFWEVDEPLQYVSALESMILMILFLYVVFKAGLIQTFRIIQNNPDIIMCLTYAIVFGLVVGLTAYNFGALVRFKIPGVPFLLVALAIIYDTHRKANVLILRS